MINDIHGKKIILRIKEEKINLPEKTVKLIQDYWREAIKVTPGIWNGEIVCVTSLREREETVEILCQKSDYAHYIYEERKGLLKEQGCYNIAAGCLLETVDGYYIIGELDDNTSYPHCLQIPGGNLDKKDGDDIFQTIRREVIEEINIDVEDKRLIKDYQLAWIHIPTGKERCYEVFAKGTLCMTKDEVERYYEDYLNYLKENQLEIEFGKVHLVSKKQAEKLLRRMDNPKRDYLEPLLKADREYESEWER